MSSNDDPDKLAQALEHLESERAKRIEQRIASGEARLLPPLIVGLPETVKPEAGIYRGFVKEDGTFERVPFLATGVPRSGRDVPLSEWHNARPAEATEVPDYREPGVRIPQRGAPASDGPWIDITTSISGKTENDPGRIIAGSYRHKAGGYIEVRTEDNKSVVHPISPGDDVETFVRKQIRDAFTRGTGDFWDRPLRYR